MKRSIPFTAAATLALTAALVQGPVATAESTPVEPSDCHNVLPRSEGSAQLVQSGFVQEGSGGVLDPYTEATPTYHARAANVVAVVYLSEASCRDATYTLNLYLPGSQPGGRRGPQPLRSVSVTGDGTLGVNEPLVIDTLVSDLPVAANGVDACVGAQLTVRNAAGQILDTAPNTGTNDLCNSSGAAEPEGDGGAQGFGG